ncbi:MAG: HAMP domain-containing protein [Clostridium sp.]|nr:HAMP domain-containing protein [Clostridium sp.]
MRHRLSSKLFVITLGLLILLMSTTLIFQTFFFQSFYEKRKKNNLVNETSKFSHMYSFEINNDSTLSNAINNFEEDTNSKLGICSLNGDLNYIVKNSNKDAYDLKILQSFSDLVFNSHKDLVNQVLKTGQPITLSFYDPTSNTQKIGVVTSMSIYRSNDAILLAVASIQSITEAYDVISEFYTYIFVGFLFVAAVLALIFSKIISNPLTKINKVAIKMSQMDFSEKCNVKNQDEIGNLANTLNFLSTNLENALTDLKDKNKQLEEDIEKERRLETLRKDFVASVSHELKTPIGIIEGYAEGLKDGIVSGEQSEHYLETIIDESKKMGVLVYNMLELSKLESGVIKPSPEIFNINRLINKVVSKHLSNAEENGLNLIYNSYTDYSYVEADVFQMEQVLTNIITNAIKYTSPGNDIIVSICYENETTFKISVINKGSYIEPSELQNLFTKFYRVDKARRRDGNSTGLGLAIVKNILDLHNFEYSLNNIEEGVEFKYFLPKAELEDE